MTCLCGDGASEKILCKRGGDTKDLFENRNCTDIKAYLHYRLDLVKIK